MLDNANMNMWTEIAQYYFGYLLPTICSLEYCTAILQTSSYYIDKINNHRHDDNDEKRKIGTVNFFIILRDMKIVGTSDPF